MSWKQVGVLAGVAAVAVSIVGTLVAVYLNNQNARRDRISAVVDAYVDLCTGRVVNTGPSAFLTAGAKNLEDDEELREAISQIVARVGDTHHPLGGYREDIPEDVDLKRDLIDRLNPDGDNLREICEQLS